MVNILQAIEQVKSHEGEEIAVIIWSGKDVRHQAKQRDMELSDEQVMDVISRIENKHDASLGVTWDTIDCYLDEL